jgi:hypothetical protein
MCGGGGQPACSQSEELELALGLGEARVTDELIRSVQRPLFVRDVMETKSSQLLHTEPRSALCERGACAVGRGPELGHRAAAAAASVVPYDTDLGHLHGRSIAPRGC